MADPFDDYLNRMIDPAGVAALRQQRAPAVPPLSPQEEEGVLAHAGRGVLGGVAYAGQMIDKTLGGRAVRGLLAGNPRELLSVLPGSDVVGVTDPDQAVSGEQLLKKAGLLEGDGEKGTFELRDLAGPAAEALLSPATYLTLGTGAALTEAGQAARASGTLAKSMAGRIAAGQSGLAGIGLPFARPAAVLGTGPTAQKFAGWLGARGENLLYSKAGRAASALFDPAVRDTLSEPAQRASRAASATLPGLEGGELTRLAGLQRDADAAGLLNSPLLRGAVEGTQYGPYADPALDAGVSHVGQGVRSFLRDLKGAENDLGVPTPQLSDPTVGYAPRSMTPLPGRQASGARGPAQPLSPWHQALTPREEILKGVPGGTGAVNEILKDPLLRALEPADAAARLAAEYHVGDPGQAARLADFARSLPPDYAGKSLDFFGNNLFTDLRRRAVSSARSRSLAEGLHDALSNAAGPLAQAGMDGDSVAAVLKRVGLTDPAAELVQIENLQRLGKIDPSLDLAGATEALAGLHVPRQVAGDLTRSVQGYARPEALTPALNLWDSFTNLFKAGVTSVWPSKYSRDFAQGIFQNLAHGNYDPALGAGSKGFLAPYQYAKALLRDGGTLPPEVTARIPGYAGLAPAEAAAKLADEMFAFKVTGPERAGMAVENVGRHAAEKALTLPGSAQPGLLDIAREGAAGLRSGFTDPATGKASLKAFREGAANPLGIAGVGGRPATTFAPAAAGGQLMEYNDDLQRGAAFIAKRLQGYAPEQAAAAVKAAHYDMGNLTGFEKAVGKRAVPFYSWMKQNLPAVGQELVTRPSGLTSQSVRLASGMRNDEGFMPEHLREGLALPVGQGDNGTQRFLSHLGLNFEDLDLFGVQPTAAQTVARTAQHALGVANPLIKAPLEVATDRQFYSGRDLSDLHGAPTGNVLVDQAVMNSPLARLLTTARTLADDRKGLGAKLVNTLGPAKVTDVDMAKAKDVAAREYATELLKQNPAVRRYEETYVPAGKLNQLSPAELTLYRLYKNLETQARERGKAAKGR